jgi:hypothetical protein
MLKIIIKVESEGQGENENTSESKREERKKKEGRHGLQTMCCLGHAVLGCAILVLSRRSASETSATR